MRVAIDNSQTEIRSEWVARSAYLSLISFSMFPFLPSFLRETAAEWVDFLFAQVAFSLPSLPPLLPLSGSIPSELFLLDRRKGKTAVEGI